MSAPRASALLPNDDCPTVRSAHFNPKRSRVASIRASDPAGPSRDDLAGAIVPAPVKDRLLQRSVAAGVFERVCRPFQLYWHSPRSNAEIVSDRWYVAAGECWHRKATEPNAPRASDRERLSAHLSGSLGCRERGPSDDQGVPVSGNAREACETVGDEDQAGDYPTYWQHGPLSQPHHGDRSVALNGQSEGV